MISDENGSGSWSYMQMGGDNLGLITVLFSGLIPDSVLIFELDLMCLSLFVSSSLDEMLPLELNPLPVCLLVLFLLQASHLYILFSSSCWSSSSILAYSFCNQNVLLIVLRCMMRPKYLSFSLLIFCKSVVDFMPILAGTFSFFVFLVQGILRIIL